MMRTLLVLLSLHAACDRPSEGSEPRPAGGEATSETEETRAEGDAPDPDRTHAARPPRIAPPDLSDWGTLLATYVAEDGGFRYQALMANEDHLAALERAVVAIGGAQDQGWESTEALTFYVNAYNALTVAAVLEAWPTRSVMQVEGFFDTVTHRVAGGSMTLNELENDILRSDRFDEPRIHFLVNCASKGCPPLSRELYTPDGIDTTMALAARRYVRATTELGSHRVKISRLFEWFAEDFGGAEGVRRFVADQLEGEAAEHVRNERTTLGYRDYDWSLNAVAEPEVTNDQGAGDEGGAGGSSDAQTP